MKLIYRLLLFTVFVGILLLVIGYARGYRLDFEKRSLAPTGIIAVSSSPKTAKVYINGELKGVTDINLTLPPGKYTIEVKKDGYISWYKNIVLKGELVMSADATLFPINSSLTPLTNLGVVKIIPIDQTDRFILISQTDSIEKDGIYLFEPNKKPFSFLPPVKLLVLKQNLPINTDLTTTQITFSPDYKQGIFDVEADGTIFSYLLSTEDDNTELFEVTSSKESLISAWQEENIQEALKAMETFPKEIRKTASDSFRLISFSPDKTKVLYEAVKSIELPLAIKPPLISANQEKEERNIIAGNLYIYDRKEDKNFKMKEVRKTENWKLKIENLVQWYPDSKHLVINESKQISIIEYDNSNRQIIYSGPYEQEYVDISSDGKLLILANLNPQINKTPDVYAVGIR